MLDLDDLNGLILSSHNLNKDFDDLKNIPYVSEDADFDFGSIIFEPQVYSSSIEGVILDSRIINNVKLEICKYHLEDYIKRLNDSANNLFLKYQEMLPDKNITQNLPSFSIQKHKRIKLRDESY